MSEGKGGPIGLMCLRKRACAALLVVAMLPVLSGCYGHFPLARTVYKINDSVPSGILRNVVFWVFAIVPIYSGAMLIDALVPNLLEFWFPGNLRGDAKEVTDGEGRAVVFAPAPDGREALLTVSDAGSTVAEVRFVKVSDELCEVRGADGELLGCARLTPAGGVDLTDAAGRVIRKLSPVQVAEFRRN